MGKIIAVANQKGGVGKTTTSVNLSASLAATKQKVLLVDLDQQGNATVGSGVDRQNLAIASTDIILGNRSASEAVITTELGYDVLPANTDLTVSEIKLLNLDGREFYIRRALQELKQVYDYILIDCPPSLNMLTVNALVAADSVLIPMQCEYFALEGLAGLLSTIERLRESANEQLHIEGLLRTMYDGRNRLAQDVSEQLLAHFGDRVYHTVIPRNIRLAEAPSHGLPVLHYDKRSQGAAAYLALAGEILRRAKKERRDEQQETGVGA